MRLQASIKEAATFSVVVPLFNKERHVERALASALGQSLPPLEIIVVDDGSTDGGAAIVRRFAAGEPRIRLLCQANGGVSRARNAGIRAARASHVAFLDADDEWERAFLEEIASLIAEYPEAGAYGSSRSIVSPEGKRSSFRPRGMSPRGHSLLTNYFRPLFFASPLWTSATVVPRAVLERVGGFLDGAGRGEDLDLWWRIGASYDIAFSRKLLATYYQNADNRSDSPAARPAARGSTAGSRWWGLDRLEALAGEEGIPEARRRWMRNCLHRWEIIAAYQRRSSGLSPSGLGRALWAARGSYAFAYSLLWCCAKSLFGLVSKLKRAR